MGIIRESMASAFSHRVRAVMWGFGALCVLLVLVAAVLPTRRHAAWSAQDRARLCAVLMTPGPSGDLTNSFERLRAKYPDLVAVAPLSSRDRIQAVLATDPVEQNHLQEMVREDTEPQRRNLRVAGRNEPVWAVTVPLNGEIDGHAWRALFLLRRRSIAAYAIMPSICIVVCLAAMAMGTLVLRHWFDANVVQTLRRLATLPSGRRRVCQAPELFLESQAVVDRIQNEAERAAFSDAEFRERACRMKKQLSEKESRLDRQLRRAEDQATVDPLTKLRNRRFLDQALEPLLAQQRSQGEDLAVVVIDLDNFKTLNDTQGHKVGDQLLRVVGELLRASIRDDDHAIRLGGDEFLLLFPGANGNQAANIVDRIRRLFGQLTGNGQQFAGMSMSAGVATARDCPRGDGHALIECADKALYRAKHSGKGRVCTTSSTPPSQPPERLNRTKSPGTVSA